MFNYRKSTPACDKCGQAMELVEKTPEGSETYACGWCDLGAKEYFATTYYRQFVCWYCGLFQTVGEERRSATPCMGHHCISCGKDLTEYYKLIHRMQKLNDGGIL